ncbi:MAG: hypothetical protein B5M53_05460 [Candidatus Cloacimonas sp. 4484_209]|nr:MAG: hypothetical protein B5M53_05460 [Candidatus Cloacimonas sp. 4484_209]
MILLKIAVRNALRYKRRSFAIGLGVLISIFALQFLDAFTEGFKKAMLNSFLNKEGVVLITPEGGIDPFTPSLHSIPHYGKIIGFTRKIKKGVSIEASIEFPAQVSRDTFNLDVFTIGLKTDAPTIHNLVPKLIHGREIEAKSQAMIGKVAAELLHIAEGDTVVILTQDRYGGIGVGEVCIVGIYDSKNRIENEKMLYIDIETAQQLLAWNADEVTKIKINFTDHKNADLVGSQIQKEFPNVKAQSYGKRSKNIDSLIRISNIKLWIFNVIILIVTAGIIVNTVLTSVFERKREIGTLRAIGAGRGETIVMILGEVIIISLFVGLLGSLLAGILVSWLSIKGVYFSQLSGAMDLLSDTLYPEIIYHRWAGNIFFVIIWAVLAATYPVILGVKMKPCDALRK